MQEASSYSALEQGADYTDYQNGYGETLHILLRARGSLFAAIRKLSKAHLREESVNGLQSSSVLGRCRRSSNFG